jgi:hypothetical protein
MKRALAIAWNAKEYENLEQKIETIMKAKPHLKTAEQVIVHCVTTEAPVCANILTMKSKVDGNK